MTRTSIPTRVALFLVALVAIAWLATAWSTSRVEGDARAVLEDGDGPPAAARRVLPDVERTQPLNPDRSLGAALRAALWVRAGDIDRAREEAEYLVRIEPENAESWAILEAFTRESDPRRSAEARRRLQELNPRGTGPQ